MLHRKRYALPILDRTILGHCLNPRKENPTTSASLGLGLWGADLDKVVDGLKVVEVVVPNVHADAEVEARVASVDDFEVAELAIAIDYILRSSEFNDQMEQVSMLRASKSSKIFRRLI